MPKKEIRILCFGASLTEGYLQYGLYYKPYSTTMKSILEERLGAVSVETKGKSGERASEMPARMERIWPRGREPRYTHTVFLGGTNDLGLGRPSLEIVRNIKAIVGLSLSRGSKVLLMTIPECAFKNEGLDTRRDEVNSAILAWGEETEGVETLDMKALMPYHSLGEEERHEIWDDGLHFTEKGYKRMGGFVAGRLMETFFEGEGKTEV
ncbi:SGNH hydrolase-type esterase domain-containing protein [Amylocarpus encephaloides]|uniref:SGNH hydrolase-type esterase domain-containing protein n=1 Tax=Amylocarpus encephaloides TaxID=45428 RepID=A0A9P8CB05_9HELO|nr:SGNH hydrolase-type esterase domain-containing protein [Amylocarpus encephaloides]